MCIRDSCKKAFLPGSFSILTDHVFGKPRRNLFLQKLCQTAGRFFCIFHTSEGGEPEITFTAGAKAFTGRSHYLNLMKQIIKKFPTRHAVRTFHPDIRRIFAAAVPDTQSIQRLHQAGRVLFIHPVSYTHLDVYKRQI